MKTLFFIATLLGAVYLIMQTPAGKAWFEDSDTEVNIQQKVKNKQQISTQVLQSIEKKMTELAQRLNQKQQTQIKQLENRIAELENELIMGRVANKQPKSVSSLGVTLHPYKQPEEQLVASSSLQPPMQNSMQKPMQNSKQNSKQNFELGSTDTFAVTSNKQLQRKRQARLQDIAQKMEMSSLQALVN